MDRRETTPEERRNRQRRQQANSGQRKDPSKVGGNYSNGRNRANPQGTRRNSYDNSAKSRAGENRKTGNAQRNDRPVRKKKKAAPKKDMFGLILAGLQGLISAVFMIMLLILNLLPMKYVGIIAVVLLLLFVVVFVSQLDKRGNRTWGKGLSFFIMFLLLFATYYVGKANGALGKITGGSYKVDNMVVAVLADDKAEKIDDAASYTFGVQYAMGGEDVKAAVSDIDEKIGTEIQTVEFASLSEQAEALHNGSVQAIVYNEGYTGILEEAFENYSDNVKIIYQHRIKKELDDTASKVEVKKDTFSVFISGIDVYGPIETNSRSDVNIIATVNPETHQILLTTTPRDYYVEIPGISGGERDKLTHAGIYGVDASMKTLAQLYDTEIQFYVRVNFTSLVEIVDQLGGIDVESELEFTTSPDSGTVINVVQGTNHFNGQEALAFSRERQNVPGGDNQRGKNQQAVITAIIKKMISPSMLMNANGIINSVSGNVETNMSQDQIQELVKNQLSEGAAWNIYSMAATGTGDEQYCFSYSGSPLYVMQPDQAVVDSISRMMDAVENGQTLEGSDVAQ